MKQWNGQTKKKKYLSKKDILSYYYSTYIGLAILLLLLIAVKLGTFPIPFTLGLIVLVIGRILYGVKVHLDAISCPFCGNGELKKRWITNLYYLAMLPLEKDYYVCPNCGQYIEIRDCEE